MEILHIDAGGRYKVSIFRESAGEEGFRIATDLSATVHRDDYVGCAGLFCAKPPHPPIAHPTYRARRVREHQILPFAISPQPPIIFAYNFEYEASIHPS